jgi:competence protein ComGC
MKKMLNVIVIIIIGILVVNQINLVKENNKIQEEKLVNAYIECLENNHTQRDYCARQVSDTSYQVLDQKLEKYGYTYKQVGYDLFVEKVEK